jgi:hypothetical protein
VQVHKGQPTSASEYPSGSGQQLDEIMEGLVDSMASATISSIQFPSVAITPLAIYREWGDQSAILLDS